MTFEDLEEKPLRPTRFDGPPLDYALVAVNNLEEPFQPNLAALIYDEAPKNGCALIAIDHPGFIVGNACLLQVGGNRPVAAQLAWKKVVEKRLVHLGFQYLE